ncbi:isochorismatase family protein [Saccharibacillus sp. CPCC 101409]|uniref:isochorismatase family protein n=1 Tax=Saccharibacillus sp. CPCC 101409 TaxID=3058041 RepID=UPI002673A9FA|nr:isochorismatase family protein [Saccharibacillus sp. CPCC 101409]MDO3408479.1 isochorismatase family protein [Saccharibacillus sp. CPCC 101409]
MRVWDKFLTERDKRVFGSAGYDKVAGFGSRPAVVVVDVSYAFCGHVSEPVLESVKHWRNSCGEEAWEAIPHIQRLLDEARASRVPIFYTTGKDYRPDGFDAGGWHRKNTRSAEAKQGVPGYGGNEIVREIAPTASDIVIEKLKPSGFHGTALASYLTDLGVDTLIVCGTTTSGCVRATVVDGFSYNFKMSVVEECSFDRGEASHAMALFDMNAKYADVVGIDTTCAYLRETPAGLYDHRIDFSLGQPEMA